MNHVNAAGNCARRREARMALGLRDVRCDPIANRALEELVHDYTVAEEESRLVLTKKTGAMQLFLYDLDDLHQCEFIQHREILKESWSEVERLDHAGEGTRSAAARSSAAA